MALAPVQYDDSYGINSGSSATVFKSNTTTGNAVILLIWTDSSSTDVESVTSTIGTFTKVVAGAATDQTDIEIWVCKTVTGAAKTVTVTTADGGQYAVAAVEVSGGVSTVTSGGSATGNSTTTSLTVGSLATGDFVLVYAATVAGDFNFSSAPSSPWTSYSGTDFWALDDGLDFAWQTTSGTTDQTATWESPSPADDWVALGVVLSSSSSPITGTATDSLSAFEAPRISNQQARTTGTFSVSDSARAHVQTARSTDIVSLTDQSQVVVQQAHSQDLISFSGSVRISSQPVHATDDLSLSDSVQIMRVVSANGTDSLSANDNARTSMIASRGVDSLSILDKTDVSPQSAHVVESLSVLDALRANTQPARSVETLSIADVATAIGPGTHTGDGTDELLIADSVRISKQVFHSFDNVSLVDGAHLRSQMAAAADAMTFVDEPQVTKQPVHSVDGISVADVTSIVGHVSGFSVGSFTVNDHARAQTQAVRGADSLSLTDSVKVAVRLSGHSADSVSFTEILSVSPQSINTYETFSLLDRANAVSGHQGFATDSVVVGDIVTVSVAVLAAAVDSISLSDVATAYTSFSAITVGHQSGEFVVQPALAPTGESMGLTVQPALG